MLSNIGRGVIRRVVAGGQQSTNRAFQFTFYLQRIEKSDGTPKFALFSRRSYATTTATKDPVKKRATAKKTSTTKPKAKKAATTKAVKKPAKKKTKVAKAAKPKPKKKSGKKALTEKQKSALATKTARANLKELKEKALAAPKSQPANVWQIILREHTKATAAELGTPVSDNIKSASVVYKSLTPEQVESYNHIANQNKAANEIAYKKWVESHTPDEIRIANNARGLLNRQKVGPRLHLIKDPRLPKRPVGAMLQFYKERHGSGDYKGMSFKDHAQLMHKEWTALSAAERQPYEERAAADMDRYRAEYKTVYGRDSKSA